MLAELDRGGRESDLVTVNGIRMFEEVLVGPVVEIATTEAEFALIVWS